MASNNGTIVINTQVNTNGVQQGINKINQGVGKLSSKLIALVSIGALVKLGKQAVDLASDLQEVQNVVDTAFGDMSYKIEEFSDTCIEKFGLSELTAKQMASTMMAMGTGMGQSLGVGSDMAVELTGRLADVASFYNKTSEEVATLGKAIYSGETEPLKQIGIIMTENQLSAFALSQGYKTLYKDMDAANKLLVRQQYFLQQTRLAAGDFEKTQGSWANQTRILSERWKQFLTIIGSGLITILTPVIKFLNMLLSKVIEVSQTLGSFFESMGVEVQSVGAEMQTFGDAAESTEELSGGMEDLAESTEESAESANDSVASFDRLNVLQKDTAQNVGGVGGIGKTDTGLQMAEIDTGAKKAGKTLDSKVNPVLENIKKNLTDIATIMKSGFDSGFDNASLQTTFDSISRIKDNFYKLATDKEIQNASKKFTERFAYALGQIVGATARIGVTITNNLFGGLAHAMDDLTPKIKEWFIVVSDNFGGIAEKTGNFAQAIANIFSPFGEKSGQELTGNIIATFGTAFLGVTELASKVGNDVFNVFTKPFIDNQEGFKTAFSGVLDVLSGVSQTILDSVTETWDKINAMYDESIKPFFDSIAQGLSDIVGKFLEFWNDKVSPILQELQERFDALYKEHLQPMINNFIELIGSIAEALQALWENFLQPLIEWIIEYILPVLLPIVDVLIKAFMTVFGLVADVVGGAIKILKGLIDFIVGIFTGDWEKAWGGIEDIFGGIWDAIVGIFEGVAEILSDIVSGMVDVIVGLFSNLWRGIANIINFIIGGVEALANGVINGINFLTGALNNLSFEIPDWVPGIGGGTFGFNIPKLKEISIPRLAQGAVIPGGNPFIAMLGDQKRGQTNIEAPLDTIVTAFKQALNENGNNGSTRREIALNLDGKTLARVFIPTLLSELNRQGYNVKVIGG